MRLCSRPQSGRLRRAALLFLVASSACGGSTSEPKAVPLPKAAARIVIVTSPATTGGAGAVAGDFVVRVEDASGAGLPGRRVGFTAQSGSNGTRFSPDSATTDSTGIARTTVTFSFVAGQDQLRAGVLGLQQLATVDVTITPGPAAFVFVNPATIRLFGAGDTASFRAWATDTYMNVLTGVAPSIRLSDSTLLSITPPTIPGTNSTVRALKAGGSATISAVIDSQTTRLGVDVFPNSRTVCPGSVTPTNFAYGFPFGPPVTVTDSVVCLPPTDRGADYTLMVFNESTDGTTTLGTTVTGTNVALSRVNTTRIGTRPLLARMPTLPGRSSGPTLDLRFHERLLTQSRSLRRLFGPARAARSFARAGGGAMGRIRGPSYALSGIGPSLPVVDSLITLNVSTDACTTADMRTFRVEAVGYEAIVLADTANPPGGFTRTDYERFAQRFDTLVYPLDVMNFDVPTDIDGNGRVAILFTRAVNELTPANAGAFIGGYFHPRDLFPRTQSSNVAVCPTSNEGEMFYMMVPDPSGTVNGNQFRLGFVDTLTTGVLAHEFQHLINAGRRMYVNASASDFEETWLNEGLSHIAEELLFFKESGYQPRARLATPSINRSWTPYNAWVADDAANFINFYLYLRDPGSHSPIDVNDGLETRGATWAFLRFAVDKSSTNDIATWKRFANSTTTGFGTLSFALQSDPNSLLRDFHVANMTNGNLSWDFNDIYTQFFIGLTYPPSWGSLQEGAATPVTALSGSASYYRFSGLPGVQSLLRFGSSGAPPNGNLKFVLLQAPNF